MNESNLKGLVSQGLLALKAGGRVAADATDEIMNAATHPELKSLLENGNDTAKEWRERVDRALDEVGASGEGENPVLKAHFEVAQKIRNNAPDDATRDLGIIASGQLALHYWIASFGTLAAYAEQLGMDQTKQEMGKSLDEAKASDEKHTQLAYQIMS